MAPGTAIVLADADALARQTGLHPDLVRRLIRIGAKPIAIDDLSVKLDKNFGPRVTAYRNLALALAKQNIEDYSGGSEALKKAEALAPLDSQERFQLALAYIAMKRGDWARPELERLAADRGCQMIRHLHA